MTDKHWVYNDPRWHRLRKAAFDRYGRKCMATGLTEREHGITLSVDHIKPLSKYPHLAFRLSNLQIIELGLNRTKSDRHFMDWRPLRWRIYYSLIKSVKIILLIAFVMFAAIVIDGAGYLLK